MPVRVKEPELTLQKAIDICRANETTTIQMKLFVSTTTDAIQEAVRLCGLSIGLVIARSQVRCPVPSVAVTVVSLSKELYSHCSSQPSCINGQISLISTARSSVATSVEQQPEGAVHNSERPPWREAYRKKND